MARVSSSRSSSRLATAGAPVSGCSGAGPAEGASSGQSSPKSCRMAERRAVMSGSAQKKRSFSSATVSPWGTSPSTKTAKVSAMSSWK